MKLVKKRDGSFHRLPEDEAEELVNAGRANYYDLTKGLVEAPSHKAFLEPKSKKDKKKKKG